MSRIPSPLKSPATMESGKLSEGLSSLVSKCIVAVAFEELNVVRGRVADHDVQFAVAIEVSHNDGCRVGDEAIERVPDRIHVGAAEGAIAIVRKDFKLGGCIASDGHRGKAVMFEVADGYPVWGGAGGQGCSVVR